MVASANQVQLVGDAITAANDRSMAYSDGVSTTATRMVNFTLTTATKVNEIPAEFYGRYVRLRPKGSNMYYYFTFKSDATVSAALPAATDAGTQAADQGEGPVSDNEVVEARVPWAATGSKVYFVRIGGTITQSVQMTLADGTVGLLGP